MATGRWKDQADEAPRHAPGMCCAYGCPMPGSVSNSTTGSITDWVCRSHFFTDTGNWGEVSRRLNNGLILVSFITDMRRMMNAEQVDMRGWLVRLTEAGHENFLPLPEDRVHGALSLRKWFTRAEKQLVDLATNGLQEAEIITPTGKAPQSPVTITQAVDAWMQKYHQREAA